MSNEKNIELFFKPHDNRKATISLSQKDYLISTHFSMHDGERYTEELLKENDYRKALAEVVVEKIAEGDYEEVPSVQEVIDTNDSAFKEYILAIVSDSEELKKIFDDIEEGIPIRQRFGIAYKTYMDVLSKRLAESMRPLVQTIEKIQHSVDFSWLHQMQELASKVRPVYMNYMDGIMQTTQKIAESLQPYQQIADSIANMISHISFPHMSQEEIEQWEKNYFEWGKHGWPVLPEAPFNFYNRFPRDEKLVNNKAMKYCTNEAMDELFGRMRKQNIKKSDLESAIFCYKNIQYKACTLLLFGLIDAKLIKLQPKESYRSTGLGATSKLKRKLEENLADEHFLFTALYQMNLMACFETYFAKGDNFCNEPKVINRNYVAHGMNTREVRKRDCIQLFIALHNIEEFLDFIT